MTIAGVSKTVLRWSLSELLHRVGFYVGVTMFWMDGPECSVGGHGHREEDDVEDDRR